MIEQNFSHLESIVKFSFSIIRRHNLQKGEKVKLTVNDPRANNFGFYEYEIHWDDINSDLLSIVFKNHPKKIGNYQIVFFRSVEKYFCHSGNLEINLEKLDDGFLPITWSLVEGVISSKLETLSIQIKNDELFKSDRLNLNSAPSFLILEGFKLDNTGGPLRATFSFD